MISWSMYELLFVFFGILYPIYQSCCACESFNKNECKQWLTYWGTISFLCILDVYFISFLYSYWIYIDLRTIFLFWLVRSKGALSLNEMGLCLQVKIGCEKFFAFCKLQFELLRRNVPFDRYYSYIDKYIPAIVKKLILGNNPETDKKNVAATVENITKVVKQTQVIENMKKRNDKQKADKEKEALIQKELNSNINVSNTNTISSTATDADDNNNNNDHDDDDTINDKPVVAKTLSEVIQQLQKEKDN